MKIRVLGSAAGGGFPQWNCGCANCRGLRAGRIQASPRTQESTAVSADGQAWFLINASPEIRSQIESFPGLWPRDLRASPLAGILLSNGDMDHCLGLLSLRESHPLVVYATEPVMRGFTENNVLYKTLERFPGQVTWKLLKPGVEVPLAHAGRPSGLTVAAFPVPGKRPIHLESAGAPGPEDNVGFRIRDARGKTLAYFPAVAGPAAGLREVLADSDCIFFDGTFWSEDELAASGVSGPAGAKRARDMAHWPAGGSEGALAFLAGLKGRRLFIHVNNTNPLLRDDSPERAAASAAGVEVAADGLEIEV